MGACRSGRSLGDRQNMASLSGFPFEFEDYRVEAVRTACHERAFASEIYRQDASTYIRPGPVAKAFGRSVGRRGNDELLAFLKNSAKLAGLAFVLLAQIAVKRFLQHSDLAVVLGLTLLGSRLLSDRARSHRTDRTGRGTTDKISSLHDHLLQFEIRAFYLTFPIYTLKQHIFLHITSIILPKLPWTIKNFRLRDFFKKICTKTRFLCLIFLPIPAFAQTLRSRRLLHVCQSSNFAGNHSSWNCQYSVLNELYSISKTRDSTILILGLSLNFGQFDKLIASKLAPWDSEALSHWGEISGFLR